MFSLVSASPQSALLAPYIEYYYFLHSDETNKVEHFIHYPHFRTTVNVYRHAHIELLDSGRRIKFDCTAPLQTVFTNNIERFLEAEINGPCEVIGIGFKPLGINHFIDEPFAQLFAKESCFFDNYWQGFHPIIRAVLAANDTDKAVQLLDQFFLDQLQAKDFGSLPAIINDILKEEGQIALADLSKQYAISRRTILRQFKKHLGCSVEQFKRVVKFRAAFNAYQQSNDKPTLTALAHNNNYYDQSDFIHHFKALAGSAPNKLLSQISRVGERELYWLFKE